MGLVGQKMQSRIVTIAKNFNVLDGLVESFSHIYRWALHLPEETSNFESYRQPLILTEALRSPVMLYIRITSTLLEYNK